MMNFVAIEGNTYPVREKLKALGARWNAADRCWVISVDLLPQANAIVAGTSAPVASAPAAPSVSLNWSDEQTAIFNWFAAGAGNLVVQARAGTGKTTTIKQAFSHAPEKGRLLYAVFNKKNQREAAEKIHDARVEVRTLHSLGFFFIKKVWSDARPDENIEQERIASVEVLPDEISYQVLHLVGFCKNLSVGIPDVATVVSIAEAFEVEVPDELEKAFPLTRLANVAIEVLKLSLVEDRASRISFNDMVWLPVAKGWVKPTFELVVVDEAQDMNLPQLEMAVRAAKGRICIVGDNRQAIYAFRGAASDGMAMMKERLSAAELGLTVTYRCPKAVVRIAQEVVPDYSAAPSAPEGSVHDMSVEAAVASLAVGDAVLSRLNAPLMGIALGLLRNGTPARIEGRDIGKQLVTLVRKLRAKSIPDFLTKLSNWTCKQINRAKAQGGANVAKKIEQAEDQALTLSTVAEVSSSVDDLVNRITGLFQDSENNPRPAVVCSSVHKAKGLEWSKVCLLAETFRGPDAGEQEANIYYVAVTRSKNTLVFARA